MGNGGPRATRPNHPTGGCGPYPHRHCDHETPNPKEPPAMLKTRWTATLNRYRPTVLRVRPGDVVVVHVPGPISAAGADEIKRHLEHRLGYNVPVTVLGSGARLTVVRPPASS